MVADTAGIREKTTFNTPPSRFTTPPTRPPTRPPRRPPEDCCWGCELYCTITLMLLPGFVASNACKSGEILELSAKARLEIRRKMAKSAVRDARLEYFSEVAGMMPIGRHAARQNISD